MTAATPESMFSLSGRHILITGASQGIGAALAEGFAAAGADVSLLARSAAGLEDTAKRVRSLGRKAVPVPADVTSPTEVEEAFTTAERELGPLDVLVNNAGGPIFQSRILDIREEGWERVLDLNLTSAFRCAQRAGRTMVDRGSGSIINISTVCGVAAWPALAPYSAAKAALLSLTQSMAAEWGPHGVRVNALTPGWIDTPVNAAYVNDERLSRTARAQIPLNRFGHTSELTGAALWLASDASSFVTGTNTVVDGGYLASDMPRDSHTILDRIR